MRLLSQQPLCCAALWAVCVMLLCRADHAASKYLKDNMKVSKARDEASVKEALKRGVTRLNPF